MQVENSKDTVEHVLDAVDGTLRLVELLELFAQVEESIEVSWKRDVFPRGLRQQTHSEVKLTVCAEHERTTAMVRMNSFRTQEPLKLSSKHE